MYGRHKIIPYATESLCFSSAGSPASVAAASQGTHITLVFTVPALGRLGNHHQ